MTDTEAFEILKDAAERHADCLELPSFQGQEGRRFAANMIREALLTLGDDQYGSHAVIYRP